MATPAMRLVWNAQGEIREAARRCEANIFFEWFGNTAELLEHEYGPYEESTVFHAVVDDDGEVHAVARSVVPGPAGLKTLDDLAGEPWHIDPDAAVRAAGFDPAYAWDLVTVGVRKGTRKRGVAALEAILYGTLMGARQNGYRTILALVDTNVRQWVASFGIVLTEFPGTRPGPYLGSPATAALYHDLDELFRTQRQLAPDSYRAITTGQDLPGVTVPSLESMRLDGVRRLIDLASPQSPIGQPSVEPGARPGAQPGVQTSAKPDARTTDARISGQPAVTDGRPGGSEAGRPT